MNKVGIEIGRGDNVNKFPQRVKGTVRKISTTEKVMEYLLNGVPESTIALIDDSGGTLTAPILEDFTGIICLGGTTRSHLGILSRDYGIPCLMNVELNGADFEDGDEVEVEYDCLPPSDEDHYQQKERKARIWKLK
ncbi:PEP-utilizing enzyme [Bacillus sp. MRMR6]|jgi:phosphoenolpyruvate-protein kinase (PTS system EI component)|uniref:PEP-utilizing enzyme n=1 Tax=Bacillus sp. MRMR6 TaxID=1928617 RepID=UPI0009520FAA|nr:PEP-utilizing enzyme [Bacillus sp. MRMR6]OLS40730.1 hypothetical protein BTR25_07485 [Bacillus sp. MRMR6]